MTDEQMLKVVDKVVEHFAARVKDLSADEIKTIADKLILLLHELNQGAWGRLQFLHMSASCAETNFGRELQEVHALLKAAEEEDWDRSWEPTINH